MKPRRVGLMLVAGCALLGCGSAVHGVDSALDDASGVLEWRYVLSPNIEVGLWEVRAELPAMQAGQRLCLPPVGMRSGESFEWLGASRDGEPLAVEWNEYGCFFVSKQEQGDFMLRYRVGMSPMERPAWRAISLSPHVSPEYGMIFPGETLFLEHSRNRKKAVQYTVDVDVPAEHILISTLPYEAAQGVFAVDSAEALTRSLLWLLPQNEADVVLEGAIQVAVDPRLREASLEAGVVAREAGCLWAQFEDWVGVQHIDAVSVLVLSAGWDASAQGGFARRDGVVLQLGRDAALRSERRGGLLAHELFHRFNGESLRYDASSYEETTWFREGFTSYVAAVAVVQAGLADEDAFMDRLAEHASSYLHNPAKTSSPGASELEWRRLPYDRGVLLSLALDMVLRDISANERSLQGFFRFLASSSWWDELQDNGSLERALSHYAGVDLSDFFARYVAGTEPLPVDALLHNSGFVIEHIQRFIPEYGMQLVYDVDRVELVVQSVEPDSAAYEAGVRAGDIVRPLKGTRFDSITVPAEFEVLRDHGSNGTFVRLQPQRRLVTGLQLKVRPEQGEAAPFRAVLSTTDAETRCE